MAKLSWLRVVLTVVLTIVVIGIAGCRMKPAVPAALQQTQPIAFQVADHSLAPAHTALSPNGSDLVTWAGPRGGILLLRMRPLDRLNAQTISGSETPQRDTPGFAFWSPDGRTIAFFSDGELKRVDLSGGVPQEICDASSGHGGTWNRDGVIVFAPSTNGPLYRVPAAGGIPVPATELDQSREETSHRLPWFLPDGKHFLYLAVSSRPENSAIWIGSIDSKDRTFLMSTSLEATFALPDHLLFMNGTTLMARAFDPKRLSFTGAPVPIAQPIYMNPTINTAAFTASDTGVLAYRTSGGAPITMVTNWRAGLDGATNTDSQRNLTSEPAPGTTVEGIAPAKQAADTALGIVEDTLQDTAFVGPRPGVHWGLYDNLQNLSRAARAVSSDDGKDPAASERKKRAFSNALERTIRNADAIGSRAEETDDAKEKSRAVATRLTRLRGIADPHLTKDAAQAPSVGPAVPASETVAWGDPVDSVQLRLAVSKNPPPYAPPQLPSDLPHLEIQIRNVGTDTVTFSCYVGQAAPIEIDGIWFDQNPFAVTATCAPPPGLARGTQSANIPLTSNVIDGGKIVSADQIHLSPGKHSIRVRTSSGADGVRSGSTLITLVSNTITVEIPDVSPEAEIQVLIEQASAGGTRGLMPARRLVDKRPEAALSAIEAAVQVTPDSRTRSQYVDLAGSLPGDAAVVFLKSQLAPEAGLFSQVTAARALLARGQPDAVLSMIQVWRGAQLVAIPRDTSGLFVANAEANLIMFLATSGDAQAIDALGDDAQAPVDVRFAVVKAFLQPPSNPNSVRTSSSGPGGVSSMVDLKIKDLPGSAAAAAIERLLRAALDDKGQRAGLKGTYDDVSYSDPRVCDMAALAISKRWPQQYRFTWPLSMTERDAQIDLIRSTWSQR